MYESIYLLLYVKYILFDVFIIALTLKTSWSNFLFYELSSSYAYFDHYHYYHHHQSLMNGSETWITCLHVLEIGQYSIGLYKIPPESVRNRPSVSASSHNGCYSRFWSELDRLGVGKSCLPSERRRRRRRGGGEQTSVGDSIFFSAGAATFFCLTELSLSLLSLSVSVAAFYLLSQLFFCPSHSF